jgi:hypothetical protein
MFLKRIRGGQKAQKRPGKPDLPAAIASTSVVNGEMGISSSPILTTRDAQIPFMDVRVIFRRFHPALIIS